MQSEPFSGPPPEPIPATYYARQEEPRFSAPSAPEERAPNPVIAGLRELSTPMLVVLALGGLVGLIFAVQLPWNHALGVFGLLLIAAVVLGTGAWGIRGRVPLLGSASRGRAFAGWALLGALLVLFGLAARPATTATPIGEQAARVATPPGQAKPQTPAGTPAIAPVVAQPTDTPATPMPTATPKARPTMMVTIAPSPVRLSGPIGVRRGQVARLAVRTAPHTSCSVAIGYAGAPALQAVTDGAGNAVFQWPVGRNAPLGVFAVTVSCGTGSASTSITIFPGGS